MADGAPAVGPGTTDGGGEPTPAPSPVAPAPEGGGSPGVPSAPTPTTPFTPQGAGPTAQQPWATVDGESLRYGEHAFTREEIEAFARNRGVAQEAYQTYTNATSQASEDLALLEELRSTAGSNADFKAALDGAFALLDENVNPAYVAALKNALAVLSSQAPPPPVEGEGPNSDIGAMIAAELDKRMAPINQAQELDLAYRADQARDAWFSDLATKRGTLSDQDKAYLKAAGEATFSGPAFTAFLSTRRGENPYQMIFDTDPHFADRVKAQREQEALEAVKGTQRRNKGAKPAPRGASARTSEETKEDRHKRLVKMWNENRDATV